MNNPSSPNTSGRSRKAQDRPGTKGNDWSPSFSANGRFQWERKGRGKGRAMKEHTL